MILTEQLNFPRVALVVDVVDGDAACDACHRIVWFDACPCGRILSRFKQSNGVGRRVLTNGEWFVVQAVIRGIQGCRDANDVVTKKATKVHFVFLRQRQITEQDPSDVIAKPQFNGRDIGRQCTMRFQRGKTLVNGSPWLDVRSDKRKDVSLSLTPRCIELFKQHRV